ncbi:MAG: glycosyltransferase family 1 protein [Saprospiraceae bacterium]
MKIFFDYQTFHYHRFGGISKYFIHLFEEFELMSDIDFNLGLKSSPNEHLKLYDNQYYYDESNVSFGLVLKLKKKWLEMQNRKKSIRELKKENYDLFHPTYYDPYHVRYNRKPLVVTVYDMVHERFADKFTFSDHKTIEWKKLVCEKATKIIAISESTKNDLIEILKIPTEKIDVIHLAVKDLSSYKTDTVFSLKIPQKYILYIGNRGLYKNFNNFIHAIAPILKEDDQMKLVCTGPDFNLKELQYINDLGVYGDQLIHLFPNDDEMNNLYQKAQIFVFPSLYEGFGLPILEAFSVGCPVVMSNTSSLPEVGGEAAAYFDPYSINEMRIKIKNILYNKAKQSEMIELGKKRVKKFSLEKTAQKTLHAYKCLI